METQYSVTQTTNITAIAGVLVLVLNQFHINIGNEELTALIGGVVSVVSIIYSFVNRYKKGDLSLGGKRL